MSWIKPGEKRDVKVSKSETKSVTILRANHTMKGNDLLVQAKARGINPGSGRNAFTYVQIGRANEVAN